MSVKTALEYWEDDLKGRSESTRRLYTDYFNKFIENKGITAEEFFIMVKEAKASEDPRQKRVISSKVKNYMHQLVEEGFANGTVANVEKGVKSFLVSNGLGEMLRIRRGDRPPRIYDGAHSILPDQIRTLLKHVGNEMKERNSALIMFMKDSGLRASDVARLRAEDYWNATEDHNEYDECFLKFRPFKTQKTGHMAHIHIGPEAVQYLEKYLEGRRTGPLFYARSGGGSITRKAIINYFVRMKKYLGKGGYKISGHSFRKFHYSRLEPKMSLNWILKLQGKKHSEYSHPEGKTITEAYIENYDQLRIFPSEVVDQVKRDRRLEAQELELFVTKFQLGMTMKMIELDDLEEEIHYLQNFLLERKLALLMRDTFFVLEPFSDSHFKIYDVSTREPISEKRFNELNREYERRKEHPLTDLLSKMFKREEEEEVKKRDE